MSVKGIFPIDKWDFKSESILTDLPPDDFELMTANKTEQVYKKGAVTLIFSVTALLIFYFKLFYNFYVNIICFSELIY